MKRILIPTDFSEASANSIQYGLKMAAGHDVTVTVIHVIELYKYAAGTSESEIYTELSSNDRTAFIKKNAEEEFEKTKGFISKIGFSGIHIFKFSPREGTPAAKYKDQVNPVIKDKRSHIISEIAKVSEYNFMDQFINTNLYFDVPKFAK